jgi:hypothetical protein
MIPSLLKTTFKIIECKKIYHMYSCFYIVLTISSSSGQIIYYIIRFLRFNVTNTLIKKYPKINHYYKNLLTTSLFNAQ